MLKHGSPWKMSLASLRQLLRKKQISAFIVPSEDAHFSEYVHPCDGRRAFITNFTGSAGFAIIAQENAALWTDGRYFLQAENQLPAEIKLMKMGTVDCLSKEEWLLNSVSGTVAIDPLTVPYSEYLKLKSTIEPLRLELTENLIDSVWTARPERPTGENFQLILCSNTGRSSDDKLKALRQDIEKKGCNSAVYAILDDIAYILNLRGKDVPFNPVFFSYLILGKNSCHLFIDASKLSHEVDKYLKKMEIQIHPYDSDMVVKILKTIPGKVLIDSRLNAKIAISREKELVITEKSSAYHLKSIKTKEEQQGFRNCHLRDGAALASFFQWLFSTYKKENISEFSASKKLREFRAHQDFFQGESFDSIIGMGKNGAIIHYKPEQSASSVIVDGCLLVDSGGQYLDGTTDITRTVWLGTEKPSDFVKEAYTRVLKGHIAIDSLVFPEGLSGFQIDAIARQHLWAAGLDYRHGTGHGVGFFLNVHEGPHGIGFRYLNLT
eukprot:NODE_157_length_15108_cov_0.423079.p3 type:complete len:494 gc:universal NODE_157_length_15108_cov_0.423079:2153-672(-)